MADKQQRITIYSLIQKLQDLNGENELVNDDIHYEKLLTNLLDISMPRYLYRYRKASKRELSALSRNEIYLSNPCDFNDPTECMTYINPNEIAQYISSPFFNECLGIITDDDQEISLCGNDPEKQLNIANNAVSADAIEKLQRTIKIGCFTETIDSTLMWAHYGQSHEGFALRYKTVDYKCKHQSKCAFFGQTRCGCGLYPVAYNEERWNASLYSFLNSALNYNGINNNAPIPLAPLIQKGPDWEYEKEWRFICFNPKCNIIKMEPDAIILGCNVDKKFAKKAITIAKQKGIKIHKADVDYFDSRFSFTSSPLTEDDIDELDHILKNK